MKNVAKAVIGQANTAKSEDLRLLDDDRFAQQKFSVYRSLSLYWYSEPLSLNSNVSDPFNAAKLGFNFWNISPARMRLWFLFVLRMYGAQ